MDLDVRFLVASDIHAGFAENKCYGNDSFETFREVLQIAIEHKVDFILLGGDLFHENNPSRETQLRIVRLLRRYCLSTGTPTIEFASDPTINFQHSDFPTANYKDDNLNVTMPIFTIHGNHDDLSGKGLSALDVLHEAGLINLFGKFHDVDQMEVSPILLQKGENKLAIYGIGSQRDDRISRAFQNGSVKFVRPDEPDSWFSILVLHQNRPPRSTTRTTNACLPMKFIPTFFDLVVWGHEHESLIEPEYTRLDANDTDKGFFVMQPGSTVATAISKEETGKKYCGILTIREKNFKLRKIELKTTRQVILEDLELDDSIFPAKIARTTVRQPNMPDEELIRNKITEILQHASETRMPTQPYPPRVKVRVTYSGKWLNIPLVNGRRLGAQFTNKVANAAEMISVRRKTDEPRRHSSSRDKSFIGPINPALDEIKSVDEMVEKYFTKCSSQNRLVLLSETEMGKMMREYSNLEGNTYGTVDKQFNESIHDQIKKRLKALTKNFENEAENVVSVNKQQHF